MVTQEKLNGIWGTSWNFGLMYVILPPSVATENKWKQEWNASSVSASFLKQISHIISSTSKSDFT